MAFQDYDTTTKTLTGTVSAAVTIIGFIFMLTFIGYVKVSIPFTAALSIFFILIGILGFIALIVNSSSYKMFFGFSLLFYMALCIVFLVAVVVLVKPDAFKAEMKEKYAKIIHSDGKTKTDIDKIHTYLECCGLDDEEETNSLSLYDLPIKSVRRLSVFDQFLSAMQLSLGFDGDDEEEQDKDIPLDDIRKNTRFMESCCPKLDLEGKCTYEFIYKTTCDNAYDAKVTNYKLQAVGFLVVAFILKLILFIFFQSNINSSGNQYVPKEPEKNKPQNPEKPEEPKNPDDGPKRVNDLKDLKDSNV